MVAVSCLPGGNPTHNPVILTSGNRLAAQTESNWNGSGLAAGSVGYFMAMHVRAADWELTPENCSKGEPQRTSCTGSSGRKLE